VSHVIGQGFLIIVFIAFYTGKSAAASAHGAAGSLLVVIAWIYYFALHMPPIRIFAGLCKSRLRCSSKLQDCKSSYAAS
jgi:hypothetical protein